MLKRLNVPLFFSVDRFDFAFDPVLRAKFIEIRLRPDQHDLGEFSGLAILKARCLFAGADALTNYRQEQRCIVPGFLLLPVKKHGVLLRSSAVSSISRSEPDEKHLRFAIGCDTIIIY